jgi:hypothetical protein
LSAIVGRAEALAHDQVGGRDHAVRAHEVGGHRMALDGEPHFGEQLGDSLGVRRAVARRVVGWNLDELREKPRLEVAVPFEIVVDHRSGCRRHGVRLVTTWARSAR